MKELETRVVDIDVDDIRNKMESLGAIKVKSEDQVNEIYDFEDGRLLDNKGYARVRTTTDRLTGKETVFMTTKKMLSQGTFKVMEENETIVEDGEMAKKIFKSLGLVLQESISNILIFYMFYFILLNSKPWLCKYSIICGSAFTVSSFPYVSCINNTTLSASGPKALTLSFAHCTN